MPNTPRNATTGAVQLTDLLQALGSIGADTSEVAANAGLDPVLITGPLPQRVPATWVVDLLEAAARSLDDPLVGAHAGAATIARGTLYFLLLSTSRVSHGIELLQRFAKLPLSTQTISVSTRGESIEFSFDPGNPLVSRSYHTVDYIVGGYLSLLRRAIGGFHPLEVTLEHTEIGPPSQVEQAFGCRVRFEQPRNSIRFPRKTLDLIPDGSNPRVATELERLAQTLLGELDSGSVAARAAAVIRSKLGDRAAPDGKTVAGALRMSSRTLQRRLQEEATTFTAVREQVRRDLAVALLGNHLLSLDTIASHLGFTDLPAFSKAFTRWFGRPPGSYRAETMRPAQTTA